MEEGGAQANAPLPKALLDAGVEASAALRTDRRDGYRRCAGRLRQVEERRVLLRDARRLDAPSDVERQLGVPGGAGRGRFAEVDRHRQARRPGGTEDRVVLVSQPRAGEEAPKLSPRFEERSDVVAVGRRAGPGVREALLVLEAQAGREGQRVLDLIGRQPGRRAALGVGLVELRVAPAVIEDGLATGGEAVGPADRDRKAEVVRPEAEWIVRLAGGRRVDVAVVVVEGGEAHDAVPAGRELGLGRCADVGRLARPVGVVRDAVEGKGVGVAIAARDMTNGRAHAAGAAESQSNWPVWPRRAWPSTERNRGAGALR